MLSNDIASSDVFFAYRGYRMNYYAIVATLARVYYWEGEYEQAYKEAKEVVKRLIHMEASLNPVLILWNIQV